MAITKETYNTIYNRAGGVCECKMTLCSGHVKGARCNKPLLAGQWHAHHINRQGSDEPANLLAMCVECHQNTPSYGKPL